MQDSPCGALSSRRRLCTMIKGETAQEILEIEFDPKDVRDPNTPVRIAVTRERIRPETIEVRRSADDGIVPHRLSSEFEYGDGGSVYFVVSDPAQARYRISFRLGVRGPSALPAYYPPIGVGDPLHHDLGVSLPVPVFSSTHVSDFGDRDESGAPIPHLTDPIWWSSYYGWPHNVVFHRRGVGVVDWNGNGLPDLVAVDGEGFYCLYERYRKGDGSLGLRKATRFVYDSGDPVTHDSLPREVSGVDGTVVCDWGRRGVWDIMVGTCYTVFLIRNLGSNAEPRFAAPERLRLWGEEIRHSRHGLDGCVVDWDRDGRLGWLAGCEAGMYLLFRRSALDAAAPPRYRVSSVTGG